MAQLNLQHVQKIYSPDVVAVSDFNLEIRDGEFVVLVGPSGCGKSTTLRMVAGLEDISSGTISIGDREVNDVPPKDRDIAMVFQNYALYPHMTVRENLAFALKLRKYPKSEIEERVAEAVRILDINDILDRKPKALSGGQRQRVAVGRAIVRKPAVFLFDEPLSNLDAKLRAQMRVELSQLHSKLGTTMIYVTHDQVEAMTMGERIVVMKDGIIQQVDDPISLYDNPVNKFVAGFIGTPPMNFFDGRIETKDGRLMVAGDGFSFSVAEAKRNALVSYDGKAVILGLRPEDIGSNEADASDVHKITATVEVTEPMGSETYVYLKCGETTFISRAEPHRKFAVGKEAEFSVAMDKACYFDVETEKAL
jgi:multiple sugar transport system ATP-binding protein